jgi:hypothetical protein
MDRLVRKYVPHAPRLGLFVGADIPSDRIRNAVRDFAQGVHSDEVLALYDATLLGSAKDGAVLLGDRLIFQNTDLQPPQVIHYDDIVRVNMKRKLLGGRKVIIDANSANATVTHTIDFSGKPGAAEYVARFLHEAMLASVMEGDEEGGHATNVRAVRRALQPLLRQGSLSRADYERMMDVLK